MILALICQVINRNSIIKNEKVEFENDLS